MSINGQGHSLTLVKGHSDFKVKCLNLGLYTQVSDSGPLGPLVYCAYVKAMLSPQASASGSGSVLGCLLKAFYSLDLRLAMLPFDSVYCLACAAEARHRYCFSGVGGGSGI